MDATRYAGEYLNAETFHATLIAPRGMERYDRLVVTVRSVEERELHNRRTNAKKLAPVVFFREFSSGLVCSPVLVRSMIRLAGVTDTDEWVGLRLAIGLAQGEGAQGADAIRVYPAPTEPTEAERQRAKDENARAAQHAADQTGERIGAELAATMAETLREYQIGADELLKFIRAQDVDLAGLCSGSRLEDWPVRAREFVRDAVRTLGRKPVDKP